MFVMQVPFIDIETEDQTPKSWRETTHSQRSEKLHQAYTPFTGMHGVQLAQTLDQTSYERETGLHSKRNQVVYRWSDEKRKSQSETTTQEYQSDLMQTRQTSFGGRHQQGYSDTLEAGTTEMRRRVAWFNRIYVAIREMLPIPLSRKQQIRRKLNPSQPQTNNIDPLPQKRGGGRRATAPNPRIRLDPSLKWLMVRQLWLWKLDDSTNNPPDSLIQIHQVS